MAVAVHERLALYWRQLEIRHVSFEKLGQHVRAVAQPPRIFVVRQKPDQLVTENRNATRLQAHDWNTGPKVRPQAIEHLPQQRLGGIEHAEIVKRTAAAQ